MGAEESVRLALFADIHANQQAFNACLVAARQRGAEQFVLLGDYVGYGADPEWTMDAVMALAENGAIAVRGNHDTAVGLVCRTMNARPHGARGFDLCRLHAAHQRYIDDMALVPLHGEP